MSKGKRLLKMTPSSGVVGSRYTMTLSLRLNQVLAEEIMMPMTLPRLPPPGRAQQASSQAKMTLTPSDDDDDDEVPLQRGRNLSLREPLATDAKNENVLLKEEVKKLKQRLKDEQDAGNAAAVIDKRKAPFHESIKDLLDAADLTVTRRHQLREDSIADALSLAAESNIQVLGL
ncbi:hypothetical protein QYE76_003120 [Lolium multiflorum]|uniref:Uncharacterized protein n=1 Tax=Lolium multiflorum TaxID=4521 RepID=A0AAD8RNS2_LOLMU|nr:hypothetical protein QYE76_003120 [Lolium multiflorum]